MCCITTITKAQTFTMVDLFNYPNSIRYGSSGYYFKDTQGYFNQYKGGTWLYTIAYLTIQLQFDVKNVYKKQ